tara:strand:- start:20 stop:544 length:525 start_codon:yes stop_codon:yes gene_type:complete
MKKLLYLLVVGVTFTSCQKDEFERPTMNYHFDMTGRTNQDQNGYYHLKLRDPGLNENRQTIHRFGCNITNTDIYNLPSRVFWSCDVFWTLQDTMGYTYIEVLNTTIDSLPITGYEGMTVPIVNGTSYADPNVDSAYCIMAPVWEMKGDTITIYGEAWFEEGDIVKYDSFNIIFE